MIEGEGMESSIIDTDGSVNDETVTFGSQDSILLDDREPLEQPIDETSTNSQARDIQPSDMQLMKEKYSKLLLGEDMSGGGKGVSSALALSNAITNLAASVFGEQKRLEPMAAETKARWRKEIDWLLSVTDYIVEFVPSKQMSKDGTTMEIMVTRQRNDLHMNIPALRKLDAMLLDCLDNFKDQNEFYYASKNDEKADKEQTMQNEKWWIPIPKVPPNGLSEVTRKWLQVQKDSVTQVLKAALAINAQVLTEMEIPESYMEALPKNGRESLGDAIYRSIRDDYFDPGALLSSVDLSSEHKIVDLKNRIEASIEIWKRKMKDKDTKSSWSTVSIEKRELFEERVETILLLLKHRFPGIPQSDLDITKIQHNKDVGLAILESYSRIIESLASTVLSRIEDVMRADSLASKVEQNTLSSPKEDNSAQPQTPTLSKTLSNFMIRNLSKGETNTKPDEVNPNCLTKPPSVVINKKLSYIDRLESIAGTRSPTARH